MREPDGSRCTNTSEPSAKSARENHWRADRPVATSTVSAYCPAGPCHSVTSTQSSSTSGRHVRSSRTWRRSSAERSPRSRALWRHPKKPTRTSDTQRPSARPPCPPGYGWPASSHITVAGADTSTATRGQRRRTSRWRFMRSPSSRKPGAVRGGTRICGQHCVWPEALPLPGRRESGLVPDRDLRRFQLDLAEDALAAAAGNVPLHVTRHGRA